MRLSFSILTASTLMIGTAFAEGETTVLEDQTWIESMTRGMSTFTLGTATAQLRITCDPDRVFGDYSNGSLGVIMPHDKNPERVVILSATGHQAIIELTNGIAPQQAVAAGDWSKLVGILSENTQFAVVTSSDAVTFNVTETLNAECR